MRSFIADLGQDVLQLTKDLLQNEKPILVYLPTLDDDIQDLVWFCYVNNFEPHDFEYIISEQNIAYMMRIKHITFWSFEVAMRTKWKEWNITTNEQFYDIVKQMRDEGFKYMTASISAFVMWKLGSKKAGIKSKIYTYDKDFPVINDAAMLEYIDGSYKGAIVKVNKHYINKDVKIQASYWDVNSMYSSAMMEEYPVGMPRWFDTKEDAVVAGYPLVIMKVHVKRAVANPNTEAWVGIRGDGFQYDYPDVIENKILYMWWNEYQVFIHSYNVQEYAQYPVLAFTRYTGGFDDYITYWKTKKDEYKANNDRVRAYAAKIMLNALYGKFGTKYEYTKIVYTADMRRKYSRTPNDKQYYHAFASYITMKARTKLVDAILDNASRFIYCDTDAILLKGFGKPHAVEVDNSILGAWKLEGSYTRIAIRAPKFMLKTDTEGRIKRTMSGTTEEHAQSITYDNIIAH